MKYSVQLFSFKQAGGLTFVNPDKSEVIDESVDETVITIEENVVPNIEENVVPNIDKTVETIETVETVETDETVEELIKKNPSEAVNLIEQLKMKLDVTYKEIKLLTDDLTKKDVEIELLTKEVAKKNVEIELLSNKLVKESKECTLGKAFGISS
jgi:hypothetical protein